jgi:exonuclease III
MGAGLGALNSNLNLDVSKLLYSNIQPDDDSPYQNVTINSSFHDLDIIVTLFKNSNKPLFLNINIQCLNSKFDKLKSAVNELSCNGVQIDVIAMQETWSIKYPQLYQIQGFQPLFFCNRISGRGGGVGFYIRNGINVSLVNSRVQNTDKIFESLSLKLSYNINNVTKHCIVSSIYRSPSPVANFTNKQQCNLFFEKLDQLLSEFTEKRFECYVFFDSNFNLLNVNNNGMAEHYLNLIHENSFLFTNHKATCMQNGSYSLIDQIVTNSRANVLYSGSIINEISDHFMTFLQPNLTKYKAKPKKLSIG